MRSTILALFGSALFGSALLVTSPALAATSIRIMPPDGVIIAAGQRFDLRVEATGDGAIRPAGLRVWVNNQELTSRNDARALTWAPASPTRIISARRAVRNDRSVPTR